MIPRDPTFAPSLSQLRRHSPVEGADALITPVAAPKQGFSLDERGSVPVASTEGTQWSLELVGASVDIPSTASFAGGNLTVTIPGLRLNDFCFLLGSGATNSRAFIKATRPPFCQAEGQINLDYFNADDGTVNPDSENLYFLILHRNLEHV